METTQKFTCTYISSSVSSSDSMLVSHDSSTVSWNVLFSGFEQWRLEVALHWQKALQATSTLWQEHRQLAHADIYGVTAATQQINTLSGAARVPGGCVTGRRMWFLWSAFHPNSEESRSGVDVCSDAFHKQASLLTCIRNALELGGSEANLNLRFSFCNFMLPHTELNIWHMVLHRMNTSLRSHAVCLWSVFLWLRHPEQDAMQ